MPEPPGQPGRRRSDRCREARPAPRRSQRGHRLAGAGGRRRPSVV